ncbi:MAG: hypothetical protein Q9M12_04055 [Mariprofundus sp.]|nr:hypothetical protein [Mariprofundus sp.]
MDDFLFSPPAFGFDYGQTVRLGNAKISEIRFRVPYWMKEYFTRHCEMQACQPRTCCGNLSVKFWPKAMRPDVDLLNPSRLCGYTFTGIRGCLCRHCRATEFIHYATQ